VSADPAIVLERHDQLDLPAYRRIVFDREPVALGDSVLASVQRSRDALLAHLASGASAYGVTTGLGFLADRAVAPADQSSFQRAILAGRAAGTGPPLSEAVVRGAMLLRLTGFLSGHAGVSTELCRFIAERLNDGWFPVVPSGVSGAAGEIVPLAHLFGTFVGEGFVHAHVQPIPSERALADRGLAPFVLGAKEGIALINGAPLAPALAVPLALRAEALLEHATVCGALTVALTGASVRPYAPRIGELKGDGGQRDVHRRLWSLLTGAADCLQTGLADRRQTGTTDALADTRQAPISLRVIPQVHGAAADLLGQLRAQIERELCAVTDSPVFLPASSGHPQEPEGLYSTGNFHAQYLVLLLDSAALAFTHVVNLLEKRLHRLLDARFSRLPDQLTPDPGRQSGVVVLHKQVIGIAARARTLAAPASIHAFDASTGQEDFQTHTLLAAQQLDGVLDALELALAHELVALRQARFLAGADLPAPLERAVELVADVVPPVAEDRSLAGDVERCRELVSSGRLAGRVRSPSIWFSPTPA
jgi:histidine ammonia-lyase